MSELPFGIEPSWDYHCVDHVAKRYQEATGKNLWRILHAHPKSWRGAAKLYRKMGVRSLKGFTTKILGNPIDPKLAMRGDIVMVDGALGVCRGEWVECLDRMQPISRAQCAWPLRGRPK